MSAVLVAFGFGWGLATTATTAYLWRSLRGAYRYAVHAAEHYQVEGGLMDERAIAYSDMATVITLDGKAEPKWTLNS